MFEGTVVAICHELPYSVLWRAGGIIKMESSAANSRWVVGLITLQKAKLGMIGCSRRLCPLSVSL